jgi:hypothetical protein
MSIMAVMVQVGSFLFFGSLLVNRNCVCVHEARRRTLDRNEMFWPKICVSWPLALVTPCTATIAAA